MRAEAGVVDQDVDLSVGERRDEFLDTRVGAQVAGDDLEVERPVASAAPAAAPAAIGAASRPASTSGMPRSASCSANTAPNPELAPVTTAQPPACSWSLPTPVNVDTINIGDVSVVNMPGPARIPDTAESPAKAKRGTYHHGDLKRALTEAALQLVQEKGPKGFTLREVARRAGVSAAAPYRHFADKAQLLAAVAAKASSNSTRRWTPPQQPRPTSPRRWPRWARHTSGGPPPIRTTTR